MNDLLSNPMVWIAAAVAGLVVVAILFFLLRSRRGGQKGEGQIRSELAALQRENQIVDAASSVPFSNAPDMIATHLATIFKEQLSMQVYKIYVGRDGDEKYQNVLPREVEGFVTNDLSQAASLPTEILAQTALNYTWPQTANTNVLIGEIGLGEGDAITLIPWRGPFGWSGVMVANPLPAPPNEILSSVREPLNLLTTKLAVALELANPQAGTPAHSEASSLNNFYEVLLQANEDPNSIQNVLREVIKVSGANSAALWRLDNTAKVLKMESAYGLQSAEFLPQPVGQGLAGTVLDSRTPLALEDAPSDPRCLFPNEARESGVGSYLGIPLMANGTPLGVLEVHTLHPKWWDEQDLNKLEAVGRPLANFIQQHSGQGNRLQTENAYLGLSEALQLLQTSDELLNAVVEVLGHALGVSRVVTLDLTNDTATINHEFKGPNVRSGLGNTFR
jgi:GAF domain-containing protein